MSKPVIVFVDDEQDVLDGLKLSLRRRRREWDMRFVDTGEEAVEILEDGPVDVLVTDLKMIGMDGKEVLKAYAESSPPPVRVVFSGETQQRAYLDVMSLAHHILTKPCPPEEIAAVLTDICALRARIHTPEVNALISQVGELPSPPDLYRMITAELRDPKASAESVAALVEGDPALSARLLRLANSGLYRTPAPLSSVRMAIARLGFANFRLVVLGMELMALHEGRTIAEGFSLEAHSAHSARVARLANTIASSEHAEAAMTAGLLHEIGKLVFASYYPEAYAEVLAAPGLLSDNERARFGVDHAKLGAHLLALWDLPTAVVEVVADHETVVISEDSAFDAFTATVFANRLVHAVEDGRTPRVADLKVSLKTLNALGVTERVDGWLALAQDLCAERRLAG